MSHVKKAPPKSINKRLNQISSNKEEFDKAKPTYQEALSKSGYTVKLQHDEATPSTEETEEKK